MSAPQRSKGRAKSSAYTSLLRSSPKHTENAQTHPYQLRPYLISKATVGIIFFFFDNKTIFGKEGGLQT